MERITKIKPDLSMRCVLDYYGNVGGGQATWAGSGASFLRLKGTVKHPDLHNLVIGKEPSGRVVINPALAPAEKQSLFVGRNAPTIGWVLDFGAPNDLNVLYLGASPAAKKDLAEAHVNSVLNTISIMENELATDREFEANMGRFILALQKSDFRLAQGLLGSSAFLINAELGAGGETCQVNENLLLNLRSTFRTEYLGELSRTLKEEFSLVVRQSGESFFIQGIETVSAALGEEPVKKSLFSDLFRRRPSDELMAFHSKLRRSATEQDSEAEPRVKRFSNSATGPSNNKSAWRESSQETFRGTFEEESQETNHRSKGHTNSH